MTSDTHAAIEAVWRIESARLIAGLARIVRDVGIAEELAQDALVAALEQWPETGIPRNPGAWLMGTAKHRAIDLLRRRTVLDRKHEELGRELAIAQAVTVAAFETATDDDVGDDLLRLVFTACHPVLSRDARVALTLRLLGGLTTDEIARAFLVPEPTIAQRIVRAKRTLTEAHVPFELPGSRRALAASRVGARSRLSHLQRGVLGDGGRRLAAAGTVRRGTPARADAGRAGPGRARGAWSRGAHGDPGVALGGADRSGRRAGAPARPGQATLGSAPHPPRSGGPGASRRLGGGAGPYALQAAIAACHARARTAEDTDWDGWRPCTTPSRRSRRRRSSS